MAVLRGAAPTRCDDARVAVHRPPGSGRSVAARAFAAALQCTNGGVVMWRMQRLRTTLAVTTRTSASRPGRTSIPVSQMRELVSGRQHTGRRRLRCS